MRTLDRVEIISANAQIVQTKSPAVRCVVTVTVRNPGTESINTDAIPEDVIETLALVADKSILAHVRKLLAEQCGAWHETRYCVVFV